MTEVLIFDFQTEEFFTATVNRAVEVDDVVDATAQDENGNPFEVSGQVIEIFD